MHTPEISMEMRKDTFHLKFPVLVDPLSPLNDVSSGSRWRREMEQAFSWGWTEG
jgi:hypothetical protein